MCVRDSYKAGLFGYFGSIRTCVRVIHIRLVCLVTYININTYMCTCDLDKAGLFGHLRLIRTCVCAIHIRQVSLVTLD